MMERMEEKREVTRVYLNTWGAYADGSIGYGWMTPAQAREFIAQDSERDGGEWFIADIDNYLGVEFGSLDYADVSEILDSIEALEALDDDELADVVALMEYLGTHDASEALDKMDNYIFYADAYDYHDACDEQIEEYADRAPFLYQYFDFEKYHYDCDLKAYEASNRVVIVG